MLKTIIPLALLPLIAFAQPAEARRLFWWEDVNPDQPGSAQTYQEVYGGPSGQDVYGAPPDEQFNQRQYELYRREMQRRYGQQPETDPYAAPPVYAQPDLPYAAPVYPATPKPKVKKLVKAKAKPVTTPAATATTTTPAPTTKTATAPAIKAGQPVSCEKGASIVAGFGFGNVTSKSCASGTLTYNAERGGKPFEIDVNPKTGELIAVKKLAEAKAITDDTPAPPSKPATPKAAGQEI
jgi:hypothetical protein